MQIVYVLWRIHPFAGPCEVLAIYSFRPTAEVKAQELLDKEPNKPEYDDYGLCGGVDYVVQEFTLDEDPE